MSEEELWLHLETEIGKNQLVAKINKAIETLEEQERHIKEADQEIERLNKQIEEYQKALDETTSEKIDLENIIKEVSKELKEFNEFYLEDEGDTGVYRYLNKLIERLNEGK